MIIRLISDEADPNSSPALESTFTVGFGTVRNYVRKFLFMLL